MSTMKRDKDEREDCEMNVDYSMKKKKSRNELWWISQIKMNSNVYLNVIAFNGHLFKWTVGMLCVWCCLFEEKERIMHCEYELKSNVIRNAIHSFIHSLSFITLKWKRYSLRNVWRGHLQQKKWISRRN